MQISIYSREATSQVDMPACTFGDCSEGQIPRSLLRWKFDAPSACCGVFDSREAVMKLLQSDFPENTAVISFYDPPSNHSNPPVDYSAKTERVFAIIIHDIDLSVLPEFHLTYGTYFPEADKLAEFIYKAKAGGLDIICQCEYGES